ncbi:MAG: Minf_1886 family protein [Verrucomicrobiota bacterium]
MSKDFSEVIELIRKEDPRYESGAYFFVRQALDFTLRRLKSGKRQRSGSHVSGGELLEGIKDFAIEQYGPMAKTLFDTWRVTTCEDFGRIVFHLVDFGVLGKTENDSEEDFRECYTFEEAFEYPFLPPSRLKVIEAENLDTDETETSDDPDETADQGSEG